jgi:hypothetical protein
VVDWQNQTAIIVGSGPSAATTPLELARGRARVIAINDSWYLAPWADVLYATDALWWVHHKGVPEFEGQRVTSSPYAVKKFGIEMFTTVGASSGQRAIHLAESKGANPILLVGFEMHVSDGVHWHEPHGGRLRTPAKAEMLVWRMDMERVARRFAERGTCILNCTPGSALKCFPYVPFMEALNGCNDAPSTDQPRHPSDVDGHAGDRRG